MYYAVLKRSYDNYTSILGCEKFKSLEELKDWIRKQPLGSAFEVVKCIPMIFQVEVKVEENNNEDC